MSLYVINRYETDSKEEIKDESNHLSELLKRIEERKRHRAVNNESTVEDVNKINLEEPKRKKKKEKINDLNIKNKDKNNESIDKQFERIEISTKKKKKKKEIDNKDDLANKCLMIENYELAENHENLKEDNNRNMEVKTSPHSNFMVLGKNAKKKQHVVKRILPDWLAHPEVISADLNSGPNLEELSAVLDLKLLEILKNNGIAKLFPVQSHIIHYLHKCNKDRKLGLWLRDICVSAPTGSGKTLAYILPIVQQLQTRLVSKIRCLIVLPVQELAAQVHKVAITYTSHTTLKIGLLSGALPLEQEQNNIIKKTETGKYLSRVDIIVATPGRLIEHILKTPGFSLDFLRFLIIDEADRSTEWLQYLPEPHCQTPILSLANMHSREMIPVQKLLFSATLSQDPEKLNQLRLLRPILFTTVVTDKDTDVNLDKIPGNYVGRYTSPGELTELAIECAAEYKPVALYHLLTRHDTIPKTLVFTNSGNTAHRLTLLTRILLLEKNVTVGELSSQLKPQQRERILTKFTSGEIQVLISSDALARGIDIPDVQLVVSYDVPKYIKTYIHRAGRTGRAGKLGTTVSIIIANQSERFKQMLNAAHKIVPNIERIDLSATADVMNYGSCLEKLKEILEKEQNKILERTKATKRRRVTNIHRRYK